MTEAETERGEMGAGPVPGAGPTASAGGEPAAPGRNYWSMVWRQFRRHVLAMAGLGLVLALFVAAVFAPFLANKYPYYWYTEEEGLTFPLLRGLTNQDIVLLVGFALVLLVPVTRRVLKRTKWRFWSLHEMRRAVAVNLVVFLAAWGLLAALRATSGRVFEQRAVVREGKAETVWVERDYRREVDEGSPARHLFPPIRYAPTDIRVGPVYGPRSAKHFLGTDRLGRSIAARVCFGTRVGLAVGFISVGMSVAIGVLVGGVSAYFGGWVDMVLQRVVEVFMNFPSLFLILTIVAMFGPKLWIIMVAIGLTSWTGTARFIRAGVLQIKGLDYITAAQALGLRPLYIILRHALPNAVAPVLVSATFGIAGAITMEAGLSFLGLGDPDYPSWGALLNEGRVVAVESPSHLVVPGTAIFLAVLAYNLVGEGLRDAIDPRLKV